MGKSLIIKGADFSAVAVTHVYTLDITISKSGVVTITSDSSGDIYYTIDGSTPTSNSTKYIGQFNVTTPGTIVKAIIKFQDGTLSDVHSNIYLTLSYQLSNAKLLVGYGIVNKPIINGTATSTTGGHRAQVCTNISEANNSVQFAPPIDAEYNYLIMLPPGTTSIIEKHTGSNYYVAIASLSTDEYVGGVWNTPNTDAVIDVRGKTHLGISIKMYDDSNIPRATTLSDIGLTLTDNS